jgi:cytochrome c
MNGFEFNKIFAALVMAVLVAYLAGFIAKETTHQKPLEKIAFPVSELKIAEAAPAAGAAVAAPIEPIEPLLAAADVAAGQKISRACTACHNFEKGAPNKVGPHLWAVVGRTVAEITDFAYSDGMKSHNNRKWDYAELNGFLVNPKVHVPGTKMAYAGIKDVKDRANLIAWLRTLADAPQPLPNP